MDLGWAWWGSGVVRAAAMLRIADAVGDEPADVADIAEQVGVDRDALARLMRALVAYRIFRQTAPGRYEHTAGSRALRSDHPSRVLDIMLTGSTWSWEMWNLLPESVRTGEAAFQKRYGKDLIRFFAEDDPEAGKLTHRGYSAQAGALNPKLVDALDVTGVRTVVDVGGGFGTLLRAVLERHPQLNGVLYDTENILANADPVLREGPIAARCRRVAGDCTDSVPADADLYLFRQVLHMWDDDTCVRVLSNCAKAGQPNGRVVLYEHLVSDPPENPFDALMDLHMLLVMGGRERSQQEYADLFERAGLRFKAVTPTGTPLRIVEAVIPA
ncbi:methyltransferase [Asanoa iriomotensis]